jgi:hypothetical protein
VNKPAMNLAHLTKMNRAIKLLNSHDWQSAGYADKFEWLRDKYGPLPNAQLIQHFVQQMDQEGLL